MTSRYGAHTCTKLLWEQLARLGHRHVASATIRVEEVMCMPRYANCIFFDTIDMPQKVKREADSRSLKRSVQKLVYVDPIVQAAELNARHSTQYRHRTLASMGHVQSLCCLVVTRHCMGACASMSLCPI
jgi:hypothetical protein